MSTELTPSMRRSILISALRDPSTWPEGFEWNFASCRCCAMGLLLELMNGKLPRSPYAREYIEETRSLLGLTREQTSDIFDTPAWRIEAHHSSLDIRDSYRAVTPSMVADRLESIHKELAG